MNKTDSFEWLRRDKWHYNFEEFQAAMDRSKQECADLKKIHEFFFMLSCICVTFYKMPSFFDKDRMMTERYSQSLVFHCFLESLRISSCNTFLSASGLYKNAYHNIRYVLESIVQSLYMDSRHSMVYFPTKTEILEEVEDLPQYRGVQLLKAIKTDNKEQIMREYNRINEEYKNLSKKVHFTYRQLLETSKDFGESNLRSTKVDCTEVTEIYNSMKTVYDFFFLLLFTHFTEVKEPLTKNEEFVKAVKEHELKLTCEILGI